VTQLTQRSWGSIEKLVFPRVSFGEKRQAGQEKRLGGASASNTTRTVGCPHPSSGG